MAEGAAKILHGRKPLTVLVALAPELAKLGILAEDPVDRCVRSRLQGGRWLEWMGGDPLVNFFRLDVRVSGFANETSQNLACRQRIRCVGCFEILPPLRRFRIPTQ